MKIKVFFLILIFLLCSSCGPYNTYEGTYIIDLKGAHFKEKDSKENWWTDYQSGYFFNIMNNVLDGHTNNLTKIYPRKYYFKALGQLSEDGNYGENGKYKKELRVAKVLKMVLIK